MACRTTTWLVEPRLADGRQTGHHQTSDFERDKENRRGNRQLGIELVNLGFAAGSGAGARHNADVR
jgi:hypothetical protein